MTLNAASVKDVAKENKIKITIFRKFL